MSLINRVLKDLEKRHARDVNSAATALPPEVRVADGRGVRRLPAYTWLLGVALIAAAMAWWWVDHDKEVSPLADQVLVPAVPPQADATASAPLPAPLSGSVAPAPETSPLQPMQPQQEPLAQTAPLPPVLDPEPSPDDSPPAPPSSGAPVRPVPPVHDRLAQSIAPPSEEPSGRIDKQVRPLSASDRADQEFRRGMDLFRGGRTDEAEAAWQEALEIDPTAAAPRQALLGALLERGERERAERVLQEGLRANPRQPKQIMLLARLQLDRGAQSEALRTLEQGLPHAQWNAEYLSMTAAVMSRVGRHRDASDLYASALRIVPGNAVWEMGRGMALRADGQRELALAAFQRASQMQGLSPDLRTFVERQIRELQ